MKFEIHTRKKEEMKKVLDDVNQKLLKEQKGMTTVAYEDRDDFILVTIEYPMENPLLNRIMRRGLAPSLKNVDKDVKIKWL